MKLSLRHKSAIHEHMKTKSAREIAEGLNIGTKVVQRYIKTLNVKPIVDLPGANGKLYDL